MQDRKKCYKSKIVYLKEIYNFDFDHFLIKRTVLALMVKNVIKNQKFKFLKNYINVYVKSSVEREHHDKNVFLKRSIEP